VFSHEVDDISRTAKFMDRLEDKFFTEMRKAIEESERRESESKSKTKSTGLLTSARGYSIHKRKRK
jgi:hypothetical protein